MTAQQLALEPENQMERQREEERCGRRALGLVWDFSKGREADKVEANEEGTQW